jgi:hypothetical protein
MDFLQIRSTYIEELALIVSEWILCLRYQWFYDGGRPDHLESYSDHPHFYLILTWFTLASSFI